MSSGHPANPRAFILVVDDEPWVLNTVCSILKHSGYEVLSAGSPEEALRKAAQCKARIDLLLCDVILPRLSGPSVAEEVLALHPEARCLFMAGLPDTPEILNRILRRGLPLLAKPFMPETLVNKIEDVLSSGPGKSSAACA